MGHVHQPALLECVWWNALVVNSQLHVTRSLLQVHPVLSSAGAPRSANGRPTLLLRLRQQRPPQPYVQTPSGASCRSSGEPVVEVRYQTATFTCCPLLFMLVFQQLCAPPVLLAV